MRMLAVFLAYASLAAPSVAQSIAGAPPFVACHPSAKVTGIPTCGASSDPIVACNPDECILRVYELAPASAYAYQDNPPCGSDVNEYSRQAAEQIIAAYTDNPEVAKQFSGKVAGPLTDAATEILRKTNGMGDIGKLIISRYANTNSVCVPIVAVIPAGSRVLRFRLGAADSDQDASNGVGICGENGVCEARPWSTFEDFKLQQDAPGGPTVATVTFKNWRHDNNRRAVMVLWFTPPPSHHLVMHSRG